MLMVRVFKQTENKLACNPTGPNKEPQEETNMFPETMTNEQQVRNYLVERGNDIRHEHKVDLIEHFAIDDMPRPQTIKELKERLAEGKFRIRDRYKDEANIGWESLDHLIVWREKDADKEGFKAAKKLLDKAHTEVNDAIMVKPQEEALAAVKEFEAMTFH